MIMAFEYWKYFWLLGSINWVKTKEFLILEMKASALSKRLAGSS